MVLLVSYKVSERNEMPRLSVFPLNQIQCAPKMKSASETVISEARAAGSNSFFSDGNCFISIPCGLVVRISGSHTGGSGSIPGMGTFLSLVSFRWVAVNQSDFSQMEIDYYLSHVV